MGLLDNPEMAFAMGLLDASGPSRMPVSFGQAMNAGYSQMQAARQASQAAQAREMQMQEMKRKQDAEQARMAQLKAFRDQLPPNLQNQFDIDPESVIKALNARDEEYTLSPGAARFRGSQQIAAVPASEKPVTPVVRDFVEGDQMQQKQWDAASGEWVPVGKPSPRFARQVAPVIQVGDGAAASKAPAGYRFTKSGDLEAIPGGPADQKAQAVAQRQASGATDVDVALSQLRDAYARLESGGGITSTKQGALSNLAASTSASPIGQAIGKALGTTNQSARNDIAMSRPALLAALMKATGMSAKQMDSNAELKLWLSTATDPTLDVEANRRALDSIERKYLSGDKKDNQKPARQVVRSGTYGGRRVVEYNDGSVEYAN